MANKLEIDPKLKEARTHVLMSGLAFDETRYEYNDQFVKGNLSNPHDIHTTIELLEALQRDPSIEFQGTCLASIGGKKHRVSLNRKEFLESFQHMDSSRRFKEAVDTFSIDAPFIAGAGADYVGAPDFLPLLGGPFYKQLYYYDYIRMHSACFYALHHDPVAKAIVDITKNFTLGRGWRVDCDNPLAKMWWDAFAESNDLYTLMNYVSDELCTYGEELIWWLPNNLSKIVYEPTPGETVPHGIIPRIRLIDPSCIWEIVTYPEDITRVLFYQWVAPTQYQTYTYDNKTSISVPTSKFIFQQIPADEVMHIKLNCVSNEKRGRSDLFPVLGYLKRLRDSVNYKIIAEQKNAAWAIDTTIEGNQSDIDQYIRDQQSGGTIAPAGSEFVHTKAITRQYLSNTTSRGGTGESFEWCLSVIAAGTGIPVSYLGTHLSGGQTRASAMVATEPVAKKFEMRQQILTDILKQLAKRLFATVGIEADIEVTFPEIVTQDRTAKLKDLALGTAENWISRKTAAQIAAKELGISNYDFEKEQEEIKKEQAENPADPFSVNPLTKGSGLTINKDQAAGNDQKPEDTRTGDGKTSVTSQDRRDVRMGRGA